MSVRALWQFVPCPCLSTCTCTLVLLRHGESTWNQENRFTGWTDVDLTDKGRAGGCRSGATAARGVAGVRRRVHVGPQARDSHLLDHARRARLALDSRDSKLAAQREALRRAAGAQQGGDGRKTRRGADEDLAAQLRRAATAARGGRPSTSGVGTHATRRCRRPTCPRPNRSKIRWRASCPTGRTRLRRTFVRVDAC